jgi:1-pyrroline-5-carboxylate dehydrogenase
MSSSAVFNGRRRVPPPVNESFKSYAPGTPERASLKARLKSMAAETADMPLIIGGKEIRTGDTVPSVMPHDHKHVLGT